jgi:hypothetical protein
MLQQNLIEPYIINLEDNQTWHRIPEFLYTDILIISFPPGIRAGKGEEYISQITVLADFIRQSALQHLIFISSTSVYPDLNKPVSEAEDLSDFTNSNPLLQAENTLLALENKLITIVRFAGLVGGSRQPGRFFANKPRCPIH